MQRLGNGGPNLSLSSCAIAARVKSQAPGSFLSTPSGVIAKTSRLQDWTVNRSDREEVDRQDAEVGDPAVVRAVGQVEDRPAVRIFL